jgi:hypothetical protein
LTWNALSLGLSEKRICCIGVFIIYVYMHVCVYSFIYVLIDEANRYKICSSSIFNIVLLKRKRVYALTGVLFCLILV